MVYLPIASNNRNNGQVITDMSCMNIEPVTIADYFGPEGYLGK